MQLVQFSSAEPFVVDDEVADALLGYAWELAKLGRYDLVRLVARSVHGSLTVVTMLLGPPSPIAARSISGVEPVGDGDAVHDLLQRAEHLRRTAAMRADGQPPWHLEQLETD